MIRQSPFVIELSPEDRVVLEQRSRAYTGPYHVVIRAKIVLLAAAGWENTVIADRLDVPVLLVSQWRKRCYEEGLDETVSFTLDGNHRHGHAGAWPRH